MRSEQETNQATTLYSDMVCKIYMLHLKSYADTEDIFQIVFLKYVLYSGFFEDSEYEGAWIIHVTIDACKGYLKSLFRSHTIPLEEITEVAGEIPKEHSEVLEAVLPLPKEYKDVMYLFYCEDYTAVEVSEVLGRNMNTVCTLLTHAKVMLRETLGGDGFK